MAKKIKSVKDLFNHKFLVDILCTASYGNSLFQFGTHVDTPDDVYQDARLVHECREDIWAYVILHNGYLLVSDNEEDIDYKLSLKDIIKGFKTFMLNYPQMYAAIMEGSYDIYDADAIIQCAIFGEVVYG